MVVWRPWVSSSYIAQCNKLKEKVKRTSIGQMGWPLLSFSLEEHSHLDDALRKIAWNFSETFTAAVNDVVVAGAAGWTHCNLRDTRPRLRLCWTCRKQHLSPMVTRPFLDLWTDMKEVERREAKMRAAGVLLTHGPRVVCNGGCKQKKAGLKAYRESRA